MSKLKEARDHIYKLEFRIADLTVEVDRLKTENEMLLSPQEYEFRYAIQAKDGRIIVESDDEKTIGDIGGLLNVLLAILESTE